MFISSSSCITGEPGIALKSWWFGRFGLLGHLLQMLRGGSPEVSCLYMTGLIRGFPASLARSRCFCFMRASNGANSWESCPFMVLVALVARWICCGSSRLYSEVNYPLMRVSIIPSWECRFAQGYSAVLLTGVTQAAEQCDRDRPSLNEVLQMRFDLPIFFLCAHIEKPFRWPNHLEELEVCFFSLFNHRLSRLVWHVMLPVMQSDVRVCCRIRRLLSRYTQSNCLFWTVGTLLPLPDIFMLSVSFQSVYHLFTGVQRKSIFVSASICKISSRVCYENKWFSHLVFLMIVLFLHSINEWY
jgi:hypothetical protein